MFAGRALPRACLLAVMLSFCACASSPKEKHVADGKRTVSAQVGRGAVNGLRYLVGVPFFLGITVLGPVGGCPPTAGLAMLQELYDYELPEGPATSSSNEKSPFTLPPR